MIKITKSKRLLVTLGVTTVNMVVFIYGVRKGVDPVAIGTGLAIINAPIYAYLGMESWRPSNKRKENDNRT